MFYTAVYAPNFNREHIMILKSLGVGIELDIEDENIDHIIKVLKE